MGRLDGKVALISGSSKNQGAAEAKLFTAEGAKVVFGDIADEEGRAVEVEIKAAGGETDYITWTLRVLRIGKPRSHTHANGSLSSIFS